MDANGKIIKTHQIATNGYHEYTVVNGKVYDNLFPKGIDMHESSRRLVLHLETTFTNPIAVFD